MRAGRPRNLLDERGRWPVMRRRPTAVYRVLDEDDLLFGGDYLDAGVDPAEADGRADPVLGDPGLGGRVGRDEPPAQDPMAPDSDDPGLIRRSGDGPPARRHVLIACAGALVLALVVARLASILLAGTGSPRGGRSPSVRRPGSPPVGARGLASVPSSGGSVPPAGRLTVVPSVTPGPTRLRPVGRAGPGASGRPAATRLPARSAPTRPSDRPAPTRPPARSAPTRLADRPAPTRMPNRPVRPEPSPVQNRPVRPVPSPLTDHRPAPPDVSFAVEQEFGFER